jgi:CrcB protein
MTPFGAFQTYFGVSSQRQLFALPRKKESVVPTAPAPRRYQKIQAPVNGNLSRVAQSLDITNVVLSSAANILGGYLIGIAMAVFLANPSLAPEWRLLTVTGFLGGLTTFSTFSAEEVTALLEGRSLWAVSTIAVHVTGSVVMTLFGVGTVRIIRSVF